MTEEQVHKLIRVEIAKVGSARELAYRWGVSNTLISHTLKGSKRTPPVILSKLGLRRETRIVAVK